MTSGPDSYDHDALLSPSSWTEASETVSLPCSCQVSGHSVLQVTNTSPKQENVTEEFKVSLGKRGRVKEPDTNEELKQIS